MQVRKNRKIRNFEDVQHVISSAFLRRIGKFTKQEVYEQVEANLKFSAYGKYGMRRKEIDLEEMFNYTMNVMLVSGCMESDGEGKFYLTIPFPQPNAYRPWLEKQKLK